MQGHLALLVVVSSEIGGFCKKNIEFKLKKKKCFARIIENTKYSIHSSNEIEREYNFSRKIQLSQDSRKDVFSSRVVRVNIWNESIWNEHKSHTPMHAYVYIHTSINYEKKEKKKGMKRVRRLVRLVRYGNNFSFVERRVRVYTKRSYASDIENVTSLVFRSLNNRQEPLTQHSTIDPPWQNRWRHPPSVETSLLIVLSINFPPRLE